MNSPLLEFAVASHPGLCVSSDSVPANLLGAVDMSFAQLG